MTQLFMTHPGPLTLPGPPLPAGFALRVADPADPAAAPALAAALTDAFGERWDLDRVSSVLLAAPDVVRTWVVTRGAEVVGTASERLVDTYPGAGYVHWVGVRTDARGGRLGQIVTQACLHGFAERGLDRAVLETDDFRLPAVWTYLRTGFVPEYRSDAERSAWSTVFRQLTAGGS